MAQKWFRAKKYGFGWTPITWQGWVVVGAYASALIVYFLLVDHHSHSVSDTLINYFPIVVVLTGFFGIIMYKTGEKPGWHWGSTSKPKKKSKGK